MECDGVCKKTSIPTAKYFISFLGDSETGFIERI